MRGGKREKIQNAKNEWHWRRDTFFERGVERNIRKKETKIKLQAQDGRKRKRQQKEREK